MTLFCETTLKKMYTEVSPKSITELKTAFQEVIDNVHIPTLQRVMLNFAISLRPIIANNGRHIERVIT